LTRNIQPIPVPFVLKVWENIMARKPGRVFENARHRTIAASAFPNVAIEPFVVDKGERRPCRRREIIGAIEVGKSLERRLEPAVEIVGGVGHGVSPNGETLNESYSYEMVNGGSN
jgi:hypothetical protein